MSGNGVSLDLSKTNTGIAYWKSGNLAFTRSISFADHDYFGKVIHSFSTWLREDVRLSRMDWVAYEDVRPVNKYHAELHFGMLGVLAEKCWKIQVPLIGITSGAAKKILAGSGRASKDEMVAAARERYPGVEIRNHDEADAIAVGLGALDKFRDAKPDVEPELTPF